MVESVGTGAYFMGETRKDKRLYSALYGTEHGRFFLAALVSLVVLGGLFLLIHPVFMTIDDARLRYVYAGYATGTPESNFLFSYAPWSSVIAFLYKLKSGLPWYAFAQYVVIGLSSAFIGKTIYKVSYRKKYPLWLAVGLHVFTYFAFCLVCTILMHFELTAILSGTAGVILILGISLKEDKKLLIIVDCILATFCMLICYAIQFNAFYATCCYLLVALVYHAFQAIQKKNKWKTMLLWLGLLLCILGSVVICKTMEDSKKTSSEWTSYMEYNKYRVSYWDYPHMNYYDDPALFESMGWTENFYRLTDEMYFMDARFNKENLQKFTKRFSWLNFGTAEELSDNLDETVSSLFRNSKIVIVQSFVMGSLFLAAVVILFRKKLLKKNWPAVLASICCFLGTLLLVIVLAVRGRLPLRAWLACIIPGGMILSFLFVDSFLQDLLEKYRNTKTVSKRRTFAFIASAGMLLVSGLLFYTYQTSVVDEYNYRAACNHTTLDMEAYAMSHPENIYVYDHFGAQNYNVFREYDLSGSYPINAFVWGSSYVFTPVYYKQLQSNGRTSLLTEDLLADNVYFIGADNRSFTYDLQLMLEEQYDNITFNAVDQIGQTFTVYKIEISED